MKKFITTQEELTDPDFVGGKEKALEKVADFCAKVTEDQENECDVEIELSQYGAGSTTCIKQFLLSPGEESDEVADMIVDAAVEDGREIGNGKCKYVLTLVGRKGRCTFVLEFPERDEDEVDEAPNAKGFAAQQMRHNERLINHSMGMFDTVTKFMARQNSEQLAEIRELRKGQIEVVQKLGELYRAENMNKIELKRAEKAEERKDELMSLAQTGARVIASKLLGPGFPGATTPMDLTGEALVRTIKPEQLAKIAQTGVLELDESQRFALLEMIQVVVNREEKAPPPAQNLPAQTAPKENATSQESTA